MKFLFLFLLGSFLSLPSVLAQEINQLDANGERHGLWKKNYQATSQLRYEGTFEHGKEVGIFKFYCEDCKKTPIAVKEFKANSSISDVKYYSPDGKLVSEGKMDGKERIGEWLYYNKKTSKVMTREFYKNGKLDGQKTTFYSNDVITEETMYIDGLKEGENNYFSPEGVILKKLQYRNDLLVGLALYYDADGNISIEGNYKEGKKNGLWKYYKNGKVFLEEIYPKPYKKAKN
jgi:antitoxin component YwqK of YwqJK toxin-antitoxin module